MDKIPQNKTESGMLIAVVGGKLQGVEAVYLAQKADYQTLVIDKNPDAPAAKLCDQFMEFEPPAYELNEEVDIIICSKSDLGYKAIINEKYWGLIYENQVFEKLRIGDKRKAYIAKIRDDDKIDLNLNKTGWEHIDEVANKILSILKEDEFIGLHDKSNADDIKEVFGISKKAFKKAIGGLYKQRYISIEENGIRLNTNPDK